MKTLDKPRLQQCGSFSTIAYGHEDRLKQEQEDRDFLDKLSEMGKNLISGGVVSADTVSVGALKIHYTVNSPLTIKDNGNGTSTVEVSGGVPIKVGLTVDENTDDDDGPPQHVRDYYNAMIY